VSKTHRIRTPWRQRWRRIRYQLLPVLVFAVTCAGAISLWSRHVGLPNVLGEVYAERMAVVCPADGRLGSISEKSLDVLDSSDLNSVLATLRDDEDLNLFREKLLSDEELDKAMRSLEAFKKEVDGLKPPRLFQLVTEGDVVARLDHGAALASAKTLWDELASLLKQLKASKATFLEQRAAGEHEKTLEARRLATDIERLDMDNSQRQVTIDTDEIELARITKKYETIKRLYDSGVEPELTLVNLQLRRDVIEERLRGNKKTKREAEKQKQAWEKRLDEYVTAEAAVLKTLLRPLHADVVTRTTRRIKADEDELTRLDEKYHEAERTIKADRAELKRLNQAYEKCKSQVEVDKALLSPLSPANPQHGVLRKRIQANEKEMETADSQRDMRNKSIKAHEEAEELIDLQRDVVRKRVEANKQVLQETEKRRVRWEQQRAAYVEEEKKALKMQLEPLQAAIETQITRIEELVLQIKSLLIRSPLTGTITAIDAWPGQNLQAGAPIMTIAATEGQYILSYVRQDTGVRPRVGMVVAVSVRTLPRFRGSTEVVQVGPQVELIPPHQLRDPNVPEWGVPVVIGIPPDLKRQVTLRPGELVDVSISRRSLLRPVLPALHTAIEDRKMEMADGVSTADRTN